MNALVIGAIVVVVLMGLTGLVLIKEMRTHRFWRQLVSENDLEAIRQIVAAEIAQWRSMRPPKGVPAAVWSGVQAMELVSASADLVLVRSIAEAEFRLEGGRQTQIASALETGFATAGALIEKLLYEVPDFRPDGVRVDVYTTFRDESGAAVPRPILSVTAGRATAATLDWDAATPRSIIQAFDPIYTVNEHGHPIPIELPPSPEPPADERNGSPEEAPSDG